MYPGDLRQAAILPFVGRESELQHLEHAMKHAGAGRVVLVQGAAGVGKTRLAEEFAMRAAARDVTVLWGQWSWQDKPHFPRRFSVLGANAKRRTTDAVVSDLTLGLDDLPGIGARVRQWIQSINPTRSGGQVLVRPAPTGKPCGARNGHVNARPLLLIVDKLQVKDRLSLLLLRSMARALRPVPSILLCIFEGSEALESAELRTLLGALIEPADRISLKGLSIEDVARLIDLGGGKYLDGETLSHVYAVSGGNAGLVSRMTALIRALHAREPEGIEHKAPSVAGDGVPSAPSAHFQTAGDAGRREENLFAREGDYWTVVFRGKVVRLRHVKGFTYIANLLRRPYHQVHVLELAALEQGESDASEQLPECNHASLSDLRLAFQRDTGPVLDWRAKEDYARRLKELDEEIREATAFNDLGKLAKFQQERAFITEEVARSIGLHGRDRKGTSPAERARVSVTHAIKLAIRKIAGCQPDLGRHLSIAVRTGLYCVYLPEHTAEQPWQ